MPASVWLSFSGNFHEFSVQLLAERMKVVTMGAPRKFIGLTTFNLFTFSRLCSSMSVLWSWKSTMSSGSTEHRAAVVSIESLSLLGFFSWQGWFSSSSALWLDIIWLCLSSDLVLDLFFGREKNSGGEREGSVEEEGGEGEGACGLRVRLVLFWCWWDCSAWSWGGGEIFLDGVCVGGVKLFFWSGLFGLGAGSTFFSRFWGVLLRVCFGTGFLRVAFSTVPSF